MRSFGLDLQPLYLTFILLLVMYEIKTGIIEGLMPTLISFLAIMVGSRRSNAADQSQAAEITADL